MSKFILIPLSDLPEDIIHKKHYTVMGSRLSKEEKRRQLFEYIEKRRKEIEYGKNRST